MKTATAILLFMALAMLWYAWRRQDDSLQRGLLQGWSTLRRTIPILVLAFAIVGFVNVLEPQEIVRKWIGPQSGFKGLLIAEAAGVLLPGGPYVVFPLISALYQAGAGFGPLLAIISSWAGLALLSTSFELPFLGWRFTLIRITLCLPIPLIVGLIGGWLA